MKFYLWGGSVCAIFKQTEFRFGGEYRKKGFVGVLRRLQCIRKVAGAYALSPKSLNPKLFTFKLRFRASRHSRSSV